MRGMSLTICQYLPVQNPFIGWLKIRFCGVVILAALCFWYFLVQQGSDDHGWCKIKYKFQSLIAITCYVFKFEFWNILSINILTIKDITQSFME